MDFPPWQWPNLRHRLSFFTKDYLMLDATFRLREGFLAKYKNIQPSFGFSGFGELVYLRTYSRPKEDGTNEVWWETVRRVVEGCYRMQERHIKAHQLGWNKDRAQKSAQEMFERIFTFKFTPPGRGIWAMGSAITEEKELYAALNNCAFVSTDTLADDLELPFLFLMDMSMLGVGVGFDVSGEGQITLKDPPPFPGTGLSRMEARESVMESWSAILTHIYPDLEESAEEVSYLGESLTYNYLPDRKGVFTVPDTREGWVLAVGYALAAFFRNLPLPVYNLSQIRPENLPIKGFGGVSSGPGALEDLLTDLTTILSLRAGQPISKETIADIQNMIGRCVVAGNVRRCLPEGTLVHTRGGLIPIEDVRAGMEAKTATGYAPISELVEQGRQSVMGLKTQLGDFKCTPKHKMAVMTSPGIYVWKQAQELRVGDRLVFVDQGIEGTETFLPPYQYIKSLHSTTYKDIVVPNLDGDMAWFLGLLHGDGYVYPNRKEGGFNAYVSIACDPMLPEIYEKAEQQMCRFGVNVSRNGPESNGCVSIRAQSKGLAWYLSQFKEAKESLSVPTCILEGTRETRSAYLAGLYDADGTRNNRPVVAVTSIYPEFLRQVQAVYASLGIPVRLRRQRPASGEWQALYQLTVVGETTKNLFELVIKPFTHKYQNFTKTDRSQNDFGFPAAWITFPSAGKWSPDTDQMTIGTYERYGLDRKGLTPVTVLDIIADCGTVQTYDISVPGAKEFVCQEGLLVHNTAEIMFGDPNDEDYLDLKNYRWNSETFKYEGPRADRSAWGWTSNNSVFAKEGMDYTNCARRTWVNGEPGYAWLENMRKFGRMDGTPDFKDMEAKGGNPCLEQTLESYELCCLVETYPTNHETEEDYVRTLKFAYLYAKTVTLGRTHWAQTNRVMLKNRRIGCSMSGVTQYLNKHSMGELKSLCNNGYDAIQEYDRIYSNWLAIPRSIKTTSIKPSGTVSLLAGVTPGMHFIEAAYHIRRMRLSIHSDLIKPLQAAGYPIEPAVGQESSTVVVSFPIAMDPGLRTLSDNISLWEQLALAAFLQREWADNQVSCTVTFNPHTEGHQIKHALDYYQYQLKGVSFLPKLEAGAYAQMPYEEITEERYIEMAAQTKPVTFGRVSNEEAEVERFCDSSGCKIIIPG
jgi:hypothetical protein